MRIFSNNKSAIGVVVAAVTSVLIKYGETDGKLTYTDWGQISGIVGAALMSIHGKDSEVVKTFQQITSLKGLYGITPEMLELLKRLDQEDRPCSILCNDTDQYLWLNQLAADQNSQKNSDWNFDLPEYRDSTNWFQNDDDLDQIKYRIKYEGNFLHRYRAINQGTGRPADYENYFEKFEVHCDPLNTNKKTYVRYVTNHRFELLI